VILDIEGIDRYASRLAKALYTRGLELPEVPTVEIDETDLLSFSIVGFLLDRDYAEATELSLDEIWRPLPDRRWERREYTYDLIDRPRNRRRAFHLHDRERGQVRFGTAVHEHCEETLGEPTCRHYLGRALPNGYMGLDLLIAAWVEPGPLRCGDLICLS